MASFEERIYELGSEALAEQERQVAEVRGRGATLLAAGALIASLLAKPVFDGDHPHGFVEIAATAIGLLGCSAVLVFVVLLLRPYANARGACVGDSWSRDRRCASLVSMASPRRDNPPPPPPKPTNVPAPGSVPKLPQTIFNLEKRGGSAGGGRTRHSGRR